MEDNKFWIKVCGLVASVFVAMFLMITVISVNSDRVIAEAIKNGANPIGVACAINGSVSNETMCTVYTSGLNFRREALQKNVHVR